MQSADLENRRRSMVVYTLFWNPINFLHFCQDSSAIWCVFLHHQHKPQQKMQGPNFWMNSDSYSHETVQEAVPLCFHGLSDVAAQSRLQPCCLKPEPQLLCGLTLVKLNTTVLLSNRSQTPTFKIGCFVNKKISLVVICSIFWGRGHGTCVERAFWLWHSGKGSSLAIDNYSSTHQLWNLWFFFPDKGKEQGEQVLCHWYHLTLKHQPCC